MKTQFKTDQEIKDILKSKIFTKQDKGTYLFEEDTYAILLGNISMFLERSDITWAHIKPTHKYSISQHGPDFIFRTYKKELHSDENEFILSIKANPNGTYILIFTSVEDKIERLRLVSE